MLRITLFFAICSPVFADLDFSGYVKTFGITQDSFLHVPRTYQSQNSLRLMWDDSTGLMAWEVHYEVNPVLVSRSLAPIGATFGGAGGSYRLSDPGRSLSKSDSKTQVYQNLDRLNVQFRFDQGDLTIGRQAITFGAARIISPTDVFIPYDVQTFNQEYRIGVDAVRYQAPLGDLGEVDVGVVIGDSASRSAVFLQLTGNVAGNDLQLAVARFAQQNIVGAGLQSALGEFGFWFEIAAVRGDDNYVRTSTGLDYAFSENTFGQVEYHYSGAGTDRPADYLGQLLTTAYQRGGVFLLGRSYLIPTFSYQINPLLTLSFQGIFNLDDESSFTAVSAGYSAAENLELSFGYRHFAGDKSASVRQIASEYGTTPDTAFVSLSYYF